MLNTLKLYVDQRLKLPCSNQSLDKVFVYPKYVNIAISKLKNGKSDGTRGLMSDRLIHAGEKLSVVLALVWWSTESDSFTRIHNYLYLKASAVVYTPAKTIEVHIL